VIRHLKFGAIRTAASAVIESLDQRLEPAS
jgi:hypothetical protein